MDVFNRRLIGFLSGLDEDQQNKKLAWEGYSVLTVAGHISGPRHYGLRDMAEMFIHHEEFPDITSEMIVNLANQDFELHKTWTLDKVIMNLEKEGQQTTSYIAGLSDRNLEAVGHLESFGGDISVDQLIDWIIIGTSVDHLENMKRVV